MILFNEPNVTGQVDDLWPANTYKSEVIFKVIIINS